METCKVKHKFVVQKSLSFSRLHAFLSESFGMKQDETSSHISHRKLVRDPTYFIKICMRFSLEKLGYNLT